MGGLALLAIAAVALTLISQVSGKDSSDARIGAHQRDVQRTDLKVKQFPAKAGQAARPVYPYSVIPGGVYNPQEVAAAMARDPVVRDHYRDIAVNRLQPITLHQSMLAYVSYRQGSQVLWTQKKLLVRAGEVVLTDGTHMIRGRCGNLICQLPPPLSSRTSSPDEPPELVFDTPEPPAVPPPPQVADLCCPPPVNLELPLGSPVDGTDAPPVPFDAVPLAPISPTATSDSTSPTGENVPAVPEPSTWLLVGSGGVALAGIGWLRRRR